MTLHVPAALAAVLSLGLLSGCPTRPAPGLVPDTSPDDTVSTPPALDAGSETNTSSDDADVVDGGDTDALDPSGSVEPEPRLRPATLLDIGVACSVNAQCATGSCVDGVCCSSAACGGCQSCAVAGSLGACSSLPKLTEDPGSSCVGTMACDGAGHCAEVNGNSCRSTSDCISGFCVDGVCCESACDQQCFACNTAFQLRGTCRPVGGGADLNASPPCAGGNSCAAGPTPDQPLCLLNDGQPCTTGAECGSGQCSTFFYDADGDGFGDANRGISICGAPDAPPSRYVVAAGDCCDSDGNAHPNIALSFFARPDACGSYDYNCDGLVQKQHTTGPCGGYPGSPECGKDCMAELRASPVLLYTQACR